MSFKLAIILVVTLLSAVSVRSLEEEHPHWTVMKLAEGKPVKEQFKLWHYSMQREYSLNSEIAITKYKNFKSNLKFIKQKNSEQSDYVLGLGEFADMSFEEFTKEFLTLNPEDLPNESGIQKHTKEGELKFLDFDTRADELDRDDGEDDDDVQPWVKNTTTSDWTDSFPKVKSQGNCGSCWAFAIISTVEAAHYIQLKKKIEISPQQLVDCDTGNFGCNGGWYTSALKYGQNNSLQVEKDYPYTAKKGVCKDVTKKSLRVNEVLKCSNPANALCKPTDVIKFGPYATAVVADKSFQSYKSGILSSNCTGLAVNHAIVVVKIDEVEGSLKFLNSWGARWGEKGYAKYKIDKANNESCGMTRYLFQTRSIKLDQ